MRCFADAVKVTLGPEGRNVVLDMSFAPSGVTRGGATVGEEIELEDRFENVGAQTVREVASKTSVAPSSATQAKLVPQVTDLVAVTHPA